MAIVGSPLASIWKCSMCLHSSSPFTIDLITLDLLPNPDSPPFSDL